MKSRLLTFFFLALGIHALSAQGFNRQRGGQRAIAPPQQQTQYEPERPDADVLSIERANMYQEILDIDVFTKEVLKNYLKDYYTAAIDLNFNTDISLEDKRDLINLERKKFEKSLKEVFTEEQVQTILTEEEVGTKKKEYDKLNKEKARKKKKRKNRKKKEKTDDDGK